jgi:hypothetical protein
MNIFKVVIRLIKIFKVIVTKNLVYAIICSNCGEFYVGETKTELRTRMTVHRQQTRHQDLTIIRANEHVNEVPSIKLGHVIHLLSVHFLTDGDDS